MSEPVTPQEVAQAQLTLMAAGPSENLVSSACPGCQQRFVILASYGLDSDGEPTWFLRCTHCPFEGEGELKVRLV